MPEMTSDQTKLIKDFLAECKTDEVPATSVPRELSQFIRSLAVMTNDTSILPVATSPEDLQSLIEQYGSAS